MKILVTGALGHIGSKLIHNLFHKIYPIEIVMVDNLSTQRYCSLLNLPEECHYRFIEGDVRSMDWHSILPNILAVIHLAALTDAAGTADKPTYVYQNNFESTKNITDACLDYKIPLIFPSSTSIYGSQSNLVTEDCGDLHPQSPYAACKLKEENYIKDLCKKGLRAVICRLGTIYGTSPGMRFHTAVNKFCWQAVMNQPLTVWETALHQKRPYLALSDCISAFAWIIQNNLFNSQIYNIVSNNLTVNNVIEEIKKYCLSLEMNYVHHKIMNQLSYEVSSDKFKATGFEFKGSLFAGIAETITILKNANR